jgi:hypothetical protein
VGHELRPRAASAPTASEVARLLTIEFAFVKTDAAEGMAKARERATWIEQAPARVFLGRHEEALEGAKRLKNLAPGEALAIEFGDALSRTMRIVVIPGEPINLGYASKEEEVASRVLLHRCARALNCEAVLF